MLAFEMSIVLQVCSQDWHLLTMIIHDGTHTIDDRLRGKWGFSLADMPENEEIIGLCPEKLKGKTTNEELRLKTANLVLS